ncbi:SGNH/GDSL hydrolase family protein [Frondihabitans peucedani]|uniref:SGNH/GDSL hydrolase family protein n=1 Tax=Frondihabitans peucedani TaxID=598626 RepID=UPI0031E3B50D
MTRALVGGLLAASLAVVAGCSAAPRSEPEAVADTHVAVPTEQAAPQGALGTPADPVRVAVVGDSLTAGGGRMLSWGLTPDTWISYAKGDGVDYVGGWAKGGTTVQEQAAHVRPISDVDVLVLMAGTNDVRLHIGFAEAAASYDSIVSTIHAKHVIVGAIPPYDRDPRAAAVYEQQLRRYVATKGWDFVDPWGFARDGLRYRAGISVDGIHPVTAGYQRLGENYRAAILRVVSTPVAG